LILNLSLGSNIIDKNVKGTLQEMVVDDESISGLSLAKER